jgi:hypothetical protein
MGKQQRDVRPKFSTQMTEKENVPMSRTLMKWTLAACFCLPAIATEAQAVPLSIRLKNKSPQMIEAVMDTEREVHRIGPASSDTFHPNVGDNPTYHVYEVVNGQRGRKLWAESFHTIWFGGFPFPRAHVGGDLKWTGNRLERD